MSYLNKGFVLLEGVLVIGLLVSILGLLAGNLQKSNILQEINSNLDNEITNFQLNTKKLNINSPLVQLAEKVEQVIKYKFSKNYLFSFNLLEYNQAIIANQEVLRGNLHSFATEAVHSVEEILNSELSQNPDFLTPAYRYQEYQPKYLNPHLQESLSTNFLVFRLLIKPSNQLINLLDFYGLESSLYLEKIIKVN